MNASKTTFLAALGLCAVFFAACEKEAVEAPEVVRPVRILTISSLQGGETLSYPGEIQGAQNAELAFEVAGRLIELPAEEGIEVTEGQLLARLDPADYQSALDAAQARFNSAKDTFDRYSEVFERGAISRQDFDNARRQIEVQRADLTSAKKAVSDTELRAPFAGRIGRTYVDNFNNVQAKQPILVMQDLTQLEIVVNIPEQDWLRAKPGLTLTQRNERAKLEVSLSTLPDRSFPAALTEIAASADPVTRTFAAQALFDPPGDVSILPGMSATLTARIPSDVDDLASSIQIPANAIIGGDDGGSYVWKVDSSTMSVSLSPVTVGQLSGSEVDIVEGLAMGDRIAVSGVQHLADGMKIRELTD
ncbi:MAG: efflux RND transporter periplasmic adaptor subunit [Woeseiaceae bacterium]